MKWSVKYEVWFHNCGMSKLVKTYSYPKNAYKACDQAKRDGVLAWVVMTDPNGSCVVWGSPEAREKAARQ